MVSPVRSAERARQEAIRAARLRARKRSLIRDTILVVLVAVGLGVAWGFRLQDNPDRPLADDLSERMDATYRSVRSGALSVSDAPSEVAPGIEGFHFVQGNLGDRWVLTGSAGGDCYAMWWDDAGLRRVRTVPSTMDCTPSREMTSSRPGAYERVSKAAPESEPTAAWGPVLPDARILRVWFLPSLIIGGGVGLAALVRISIALLTGRAPSEVRR